MLDITLYKYRKLAFAYNFFFLSEFRGLFNFYKTVIPFALVGHKIIVANSVYAALRRRPNAREQLKSSLIQSALEEN